MILGNKLGYAYAYRSRIRCSNEAARVRIVGGEGYASREEEEGAGDGRADVRRQVRMGGVSWCR